MKEFVPKAGQTDYTNKKTAPVIVCFVCYQGKYLLLKRSDQVLGYKNLWSNTAGFLDDNTMPEEKIVGEITEELGLNKKDIKTIKHIETYTYKDENIGRDWIRHLYVAEITNSDITLDWEHTEYKWIDPEEIVNFETTPGLVEDLQKIIRF